MAHHRLTGGARATIALLLMAVLAAAAFAWWQYRRAEEAKEQLGLDAGRVLSAVFTQARDLRVATLRGEVLARSTNDGTFFDSEQITRAPYAASYFVDLSRVGRDSYAWDAERRILTVDVPDVRVEQPAIDLAKAKVRQRGVWISRAAGLKLQRQASERLTGIATERARSDENMARARAAATRAVAMLVRDPLRAAGFDGVEVRVRFPWEGGGSSERWDTSRSPAEVLANAN